MSRIILIDGSGLMHRCYHANKRGGAADAREVGDGLGAVSQFEKTLDSLMRRMGEDPGFTHFGIIFDASRSHARLEMFPGYKGQRPPLPDDFRAQIEPMKQAAARYGATLEIDGYEADDIIATYARIATEMGMEAVIVTQDKDLCQCIEPGIRMFDPMKKIFDGVPCHIETLDDWGRPTEIWSEKGKLLSIGEFLDEDSVVERWGCSPSLIPDMLAIIGDTADNIKGLDGIGEKGARELIATFGDLEAVLCQADNPALKPKQRNSIRDCAEQARLAKRLITIDRHVPVPEPISYFETL